MSATLTNHLMKTLRERNIKTKKFENNASIVSYKTGFPVLDYHLGYRVNVFNADDEMVDSYACIGIPAGSYIEFIGKPSTSKTTAAVQIAANIVRNFDNGSVIHFDLEQAMNLSRLKTLTRFKINTLKEKYTLRQENTTLEDMKETIIEVCEEKNAHPEIYKYESDVLNEFGEKIVLFEPTVVILDSIATISNGLNIESKKDLEKMKEISSQTERMRLTGEIGRFFTEILPYLRTYNIILIAINQIKVNPNMGIVKSPAEILYLQQDEALPGGRTPQFLAHILIKFVAVGGEKFTKESDGFDGFGVQLRIIKSRTNQAGQVVPMIYDKVRGLDTVRSSVRFCKDIGLLGGNRNGYYINGDKDHKFTLMNMNQNFRENKELYKILYGTIVPVLENHLSAVSEAEMEVSEEEFDY